MRTRVEITGTLRAEAPIHVGGGDRGALVDAPVLIDGAGRPLIPGTSLAGVLRSALGGGTSDRRCSRRLGAESGDGLRRV